MKRVLLTGMSGTGKSTVIRELAVRGYKAIDTDYGGYAGLVDDEWLWDEKRIRHLLTTEDAEILFLSGCVRNQGTFYPWFDAIVLLSLPKEAMLERLATRTTNDFGKGPQQLKDILADLEYVEPLLRQGATLEIDTQAPVGEVVKAVLAHVGISGET